MKHTKLSLLLLLMTAVLVPTFQSCNKYNDGPMFSLRSKTERVANSWKVENYKINGADWTSLVTNYKETYTKGGDYSYAWGSANGSGKWSFQNNEEEIKLNGTDGQSSRTLIILKLEENTFWYYYMSGNDRHELHFVSN